MIEIFSFSNSITEKIEDFTQDCWVNLVDPSESEIKKVSAYFGIEEEDLVVALDEDESARLSIDDGVMLAVVDMPIVQKDTHDSYYYSTLPLGLISCYKGLITISAKQSTIIHNLIEGRVRQTAFKSKIQFMLSLLMAITSKFLHCLKLIDRASSNIEAKLSQSIKNEELLKAMRLEKSLMYFTAALSGNKAIFTRLFKSPYFTHSPEELEMLEDLITENKQAIEMCTIYRNILESTMDTKAAIISNNLNIAMKWLTSLTIVLTIPSIIFSLFGINTGIPWQGDHIGFWVVLGISFLFSIGAAAILWKNDLF